MTTELRMTTRAAKTTTTAAPIVMASRKAAKAGPDQAADQFAAMFAALCLVPLPQPQPTPAAKPEEAAPASSVSSSEIAGSDGARESSTPVINSQSLAPDKGIDGTSTSTNIELAPAPAWSQIPAPSGSLQGTASPAASPQMTETIRTGPVMTLPPAAKTQEPTATDGIADPEIVGSDKIVAAPLTPFIDGGTSGKVAPETAVTGASLPTNVELAPAPVWSQIPALSASHEAALETQAATPSDGIANPEIAGSDRIPVSLTPVINLRTIAPESGQIAPETAKKASSLPVWAPATLFSSKPGFEGLPFRPAQTELTSAPANVELLPAPSWQSPIPAASQRLEIESPYADAQTAQTVPLALGVILPPAIGRTTYTRQLDPSLVGPQLQVADESKLADPLVAQQPPVAVEGRLTDQTLQTNAARRASSLVDSLAQTTLTEGGGNAAVGGKNPLSGNGFDLRGNDSQRDSNFVPPSRLPGLSGEVSFATTVRDLQSGGGGSSIQSQTISQIMAQAETLPGRQMRSFRLRLRPEELGEIDIQLSRDAAGRISAHISAERESARGTLSRSLDELRATLSRAGLSVDKLQISTEPGLSTGNRGTEDARSNTRESPSGVANSLSQDETETSGRPLAEDEKLLSLHA